MSTGCRPEAREAMASSSRASTWPATNCFLAFADTVMPDVPTSQDAACCAAARSAPIWAQYAAAPWGAITRTVMLASAEPKAARTAGA